jgi:post-segregation antitoxin (ccd killing protein)
MGFIVDEWAPGDLREDALNIAYTSFEAIERRMIDGIEYAAGVQAAVDEEELLTPRERALAWRRANGEALAGLNQPINQRRRRRNA